MRNPSIASTNIYSRVIAEGKVNYNSILCGNENKNIYKQRPQTRTNPGRVERRRAYWRCIRGIPRSTRDSGGHARARGRRVGASAAYLDQERLGPVWSPDVGAKSIPLGARQSLIVYIFQGCVRSRRTILSSDDER